MKEFTTHKETSITFEFSGSLHSDAMFTKWQMHWNSTCKNQIKERRLV